MIRTDRFAPDTAVGRQVAHRVAAEFASSLQAIAAALSRHTGDSLLASQLGTGIRPNPFAVAAYLDLLRTVLDDDVPPAVAAFGVVMERLDRPARPFLQGWGDLPPEEQACFLRHINSDETTAVTLTAPLPEQASRGEAAIREAFELLDRIDPQQAGEVRSIIQEIVLVTGTVNGGGSFDGATSFELWGALFLNAEHHGNRLDAVDGLVHESAHALLFGLSLGAPFVDNPPEQRFASPLRLEPRPLDGIFHATFVSARMYRAQMQLHGAAAALTAAEHDAMLPRLAASRQAFVDGRQTLEAHAQLTELGRDLLRAASAYVDDAPLPG